jgi:pSer/pThr/pTyr-binding forkhead associated (FHA) protein
MTWILTGNGAADGKTLVLRVTPGAARTLGRGPQANFVVEAPLVSRLHCRFTAESSGTLDVEDLGSTNGTWVNGQRVVRAALAAGDRVRVGQLELVVGRP